MCGPGDKLPELIDYMMNKKLDILGIADMRKKGRSIKEIEKDCILIWSGVDEQERAKHGAGFPINPYKIKCILDVEYKL